MTRTIQLPVAYWSLTSADLCRKLESSKDGLTDEQARKHLGLYGANLLKVPKRADVVALLLAQFKSPIILILFFATGSSATL